MVRTVVGVVVGAVAWMAAFFVLTWCVALAWPAYALQGQAYLRDGVYGFTPPMSATNAFLWFVAEVGAGAVAALLAGRRQAGFALAALLMLYMCAMHLVLYWDRFPWWYNLAVALPSGAAVLLGAALARPRPVTGRVELAH